MTAEACRTAREHEDITEVSDPHLLTIDEPTEHPVPEMRIIKGKPTDAELADAVEFASIDNMRRMEVENAKKIGGQRSMKPGNADDPSSFKVRRGKVGGWRDYVTDDEAEALEKMVRERLNPVGGTRGRPRALTATRYNAK